MEQVRNLNLPPSLQRLLLAVLLMLAQVSGVSAQGGEDEIYDPVIGDPVEDWQAFSRSLLDALQEYGLSLDMSSQVVSDAVNVATETNVQWSDYSFVIPNDEYLVLTSMNIHLPDTDFAISASLSTAGVWDVDIVSGDYQPAVATIETALVGSGVDMCQLIVTDTLAFQANSLWGLERSTFSCSEPSQDGIPGYGFTITSSISGLRLSFTEGGKIVDETEIALEDLAYFVVQLGTDDGMLYIPPGIFATIEQSRM